MKFPPALKQQTAVIKTPRSADTIFPTILFFPFWQIIFSILLEELSVNQFHPYYKYSAV